MLKSCTMVYRKDTNLLTAASIYSVTKMSFHLRANMPVR